MRYIETEGWAMATAEPVVPLKVLAPPTPCENVDGENNRCPNFERCKREEIACHSYYLHISCRHPRKRPYLPERLIPDRQWFEKAFSA